MSWRLRVRHTTTYQLLRRRARVVQRGAHLAARHRRTSSRSNTASRCTPRPTCSATATTGAAGSTLRPPPAAHRAHRGRLVAGGDGGTHAQPRRHGRVGRHRRARAHRPLLRVPQRHRDDRVRRHHPPVRRASCARAPTPAAALSQLGDWLRDHVEYQTGTTSVSTTAVEALRAGRGVCQDYAHLGSRSCAPRASPPATRRATSTPTSSAAWSARRTQGESHAWLEAWVGDWHPLDPTSGSRGRRAPRARRARPRLHRRRAAQGRVPRRPEPRARRGGGADARRVTREAPAAERAASDDG